ncbi:hypothetical protein QAD02_009517 [Eretmocerus hayati]|uniref:Uncharacterized protein n=1 Tax=Eretmocerus hayati TaxID=131215 RepID=A0ACC2N9G5_9HYME|nr:hypothetical protein QAD02_009517 [Eretmocerus hayati]
MLELQRQQEIEHAEILPDELAEEPEQVSVASKGKGRSSKPLGVWTGFAHRCSRPQQNGTSIHRYVRTTSSGIDAIAPSKQPSTSGAFQLAMQRSTYANTVPRCSDIMPGPSPVPATSWTIATSTIISGEAMTLDFASLLNDLPPMLSASTSVRSVANLSTAIDLPPLIIRDLDDGARSPLGLPPIPMTPKHLRRRDEAELLPPSPSESVPSIRMRITRCDPTTAAAAIENETEGDNTQ